VLGNGNIIVSGVNTMPQEILNLNIDATHIVIAVLVIIILTGLIKPIGSVLSFKKKTDNYIDERIDSKITTINHEVEELKREQCCIKTEQSVTKEDITEIKLQMMKMSTSLEFIAQSIRDFTQIRPHD